MECAGLELQHAGKPLMIRTWMPTHDATHRPARAGETRSTNFGEKTDQEDVGVATPMAWDFT